MRLFQNMPLKLLAIIFAMVLWFHVATNQRYDLEVLYSIHFVNIPPSLVIAEGPVDEVGVFLRGSGKALMRLMWGERRWPIDLSRARAGRQQIPIQAANVPLYGIQDLEVLGLVDLDTLTVTLDSLGHKTVPIRSAVEIEAGEEFVRALAVVPPPLQALKLDPDSVTVQRHERSRADSGD